jgi:short-subunit dehydrogenase
MVEKTGSVLVTGASGGIGEALARVFAAKGHDLVLVARTEAALQRLAAELGAAHGIKALSLPADLRDPAAPSGLAAELGRRGVPIEILVNNAGFGALGPFKDMDRERLLDMVRVNVLALTELTALFLPAMAKRGRGGILNVASTAAFAPGPQMSLYHATKAFVLSFSEGLAEELRDSGVSVTALCPGPTATGFFAVSGSGSPPLPWLRGSMRAEEVARFGYASLMRGRVVALPGLRNRIQAFSPRLLPRALVRKIVAWLRRPPSPDRG